MGVESANYMFVPTAEADAVLDVVRELGGARREPTPKDLFDRWVLRGDAYWLDVMVINTSGTGGRSSVSIRSALCNPVGVLDVLRSLLTTILERVPGRLHDQQANRSYSEVTDEAWSEIRDAYERKRSKFLRWYGPFEAAISGEDVFPTLHARKGRSGSRQ